MIKKGDIVYHTVKGIHGFVLQAPTKDRSHCVISDLDKENNIDCLEELDCSRLLELVLEKGEVYHTSKDGFVLQENPTKK